MLIICIACCIDQAIRIYNTSGNQFVLILINYDSHNTCKHLLAVSAVSAVSASFCSFCSLCSFCNKSWTTAPKLHVAQAHPWFSCCVVHYNVWSQRSPTSLCIVYVQTLLWTAPISHVDTRFCMAENKTEYLFRIMQINTCLVMNVVRNAFTFLDFFNNSFYPAVSAVSAVSASFCSYRIFLQCKPMCITHIDYYSYECLYACSW